MTSDQDDVLSLEFVSGIILLSKHLQREMDPKDSTRLWSSADSNMQICIKQFQLGTNEFIALWPLHNRSTPDKVIGDEFGQLVDGSQSPKMRPITIISVGNTQPVSKEWLVPLIEHFNTDDDVFQCEFLEGVLFTYTGFDSCDIAIEARNYLESKGTKAIRTRLVSSNDVPPKPGPYMYFDGHLHPAWKLYEDINGAFLEALVPNSEG